MAGYTTRTKTKQRRAVRARQSLALHLNRDFYMPIDVLDGDKYCCGSEGKCCREPQEIDRLWGEFKSWGEHGFQELIVRWRQMRKAHVEGALEPPAGRTDRHG